jgi:AGCS family alanine or glycine:cation symporter
MYYIQNGLESRWRWLAVLFSIFGALAAFGIGNTVQANTVATAVESSLHLPVWVSGLAMAIFTGAVIIGGIRRLGAVAAKLVPFMAISYIAGALIIILLNVEQVPTALMTIIYHAFNGTAAAGGFAGATVLMAIHFGVARGLFSNEAGLGSAPIAHAAAKTKDPVHQGLIAMLGTFIDTIVGAVSRLLDRSKVSSRNLRKEFAPPSQTPLSGRECRERYDRRIWQDSDCGLDRGTVDESGLQDCDLESRLWR